MIYTCYEMIRDCGADKAEGWSYFLAHYVPVMRRLLAHYFPQRAGDRALIERVLMALRAPASSLFRSMDPAPERLFVSALRQQVMVAVEADCASDAPEIALDLATLSDALAPLTLVEKEAAWLEAMRYPPEDAGRMLRIDPKTAGKIRDRAAELLRGKLDTWRRTVLADNGPVLGRVAAAQSTAECIEAKALLDVIDGRATWSRREAMERHVTGCWHCIDHLCRLHEVCDVLRSSQPLTEAEAQPFRALLGIRTEKTSLWQKIRPR